MWSGGDFRFEATFLMELSVIIVNYNVKHFLEQCLYSVQEAIKGIEAEVIVIDNCSIDNSLAYLKPVFPQVRFVANKENIGFSKACNQGLGISKGNYVLFLNPDTLIPEDCFEKCISFLQSHPDAGALGIKMLDGSGKFLKESKRSYPSPATSLYKLFGFSILFPHSKVFSKYHLGNLDKDHDHEVDVLAGAFMMVKKEVLDKTGSFDETFFMYGEDVDLSFRIQKAGYKNYYFAGSSIIHFKGESTRKGTLNYIRMFYRAMSIFVRKQFGGSRAGLFNFLIQAAIWSRAIMTAVGNFIRKIGLPLVDAGLILLSFWLTKSFWNDYVRPDVRYDNKLLWISLPIFTVAYIIIAYYAGLYDRRYKRPRLIRSAFITTIILLAGYGLLPEEYRFSRAIILLGSLLAFMLVGILRWILVKTRVLSSRMEQNESLNTIIIGSPEEYEHTLRLMKEAGYKERVIGRVAVNENDTTGIGYWKKLNSLYKNIPFHEVVFCLGTISFGEILKEIPQLPLRIKMKFHFSDSKSIIGSDSRNISGEALSKENGFKLSDPYNRRIKRLGDVVVSLLGIITFPIQLFIIKKPAHFFVNCLAVLFAKKTWIGYITGEKPTPQLKRAILTCNGVPVSQKQELPQESVRMINYWYAHDYELRDDLKIILRKYKWLGA